MRRFFIIFLLLVLPFQASWAAVATYCQHETDVKVQHMGHHAHEHEEAASHAAADPQAPTVDNDCAACHMFSASVIVMPQALFATQSITGQGIISSADFTQILRPTRPERPKWSRAA
jgi:hypothetical protein